ncbi:MAG: hypothetical protein COX83_03780 [Candidatus Magasanikbacteria bacterium CG_4_10_14_0_2_um_filter_41_31]|uniref:Glycosyl transferase family 1 domain-containing protein n=1 Tax=Candidatus Magasanikbacteria bacterium CG_4_10_14_0_2_um_filter_41_31 TaxID=1974639 RepID=A0A2M7V2I4_9BACT|nr:MAG: hypothetical protein COX83_03780 [Candidatus Magasanikbacteria bacterium CG_4_10_14_0_2_um_filter_41_31]
MATKEHSLNVLFFSPYFYPYISGLTQYPYRLFMENGLPIKTMCLTFHHDPHLPTDQEMGPLLHVRRMPFLFRISKGFISPQSLVHFWNETKKNDVVMVNLPSFEGLLLSIFAVLQRKPLISLLHCEVLLPFSIPNITINFILNCGVFFQLFLSKKIIVYTEDYYEKKWMYHFFKDKMEVIPPPVHTSAPNASYLKELGIMKNKYKYSIGFCGRIAAEKGIEILIESVSSLKNTIVFFAGPTGKDVIGEEIYYAKIQRLLNMKKIPHVFLGILSAGKLSSFYRIIDVLVLPSLNKTEAFGMVQVEAMLQGTPVIASNLPGVRVPIILTKMGILTAPYNSLEIKDAILEIVNFKEKYSNKELIENAKNIFDSKKTYDSIYSVIKSQMSQIRHSE